MTSAPGSAAKVRQRGGIRTFLSIAVTGFGVQLLTVVSGPLVARMLGPDGRGQMVLVTVVSMLCCLAAVGGLPSAIAHTVAVSGHAARDVVGAMLRIWLVAMLAPAAVAGGIMAIVLRDSPRQFELAAVTFGISYSLAVQFILGAMLQGEGNVRLVNLQRLIGMASYVFVVAALFILDPTDQSVVLLLIYLASLFGGFVVAWSMLRRPVGDPAMRASRRDVHTFARRGFVSGLNALDALGIDQLLVGVVLGQVALGLYAVAVSVTSVPTIVLGGVATILLPRMAALRGEDALVLMRKWILAAIVLVLLLVAGIEIVVGPALRIFFGEDFVPAIGVARILGLAWAFLALRRVLTAAAQAQGRVSGASVAELGSTVVMVIGVVIGMHFWDLKGVGFGMLAASVLCCGWLAAILTWRSNDDPGTEQPEIGLIDVIEIDDADHRGP